MPSPAAVAHIRRLESIIRPAPYAALIAVMYVVASIFYILLSSEIAKRVVHSVTELLRLEVLKGLVFCGVTGLILFGLAYLLLYQIARQQRQLLESQLVLVESERRSLAADFATSVAHDLAHILVSVRGGLDRLEASPEAERGTNIAELRDVVEDLAVLSRRLMDLGQPASGPRGQNGEIDAATHLERGVKVAQLHMAVRSCEVVLENELPAGTLLIASRSTLRRTLLNLIVNAAEATSSRGRVRIHCRRDGANAVVEVHDNGPGIPPELLEEIFDPFFSTKPRGLGVGLASARACVKEDGGQLSATPSPDGGACLLMRLPARFPGE